MPLIKLPAKSVLLNRALRRKGAYLAIAACVVMVTTCTSPDPTDTASIAVAANFTEAAQAIGHAFHDETGLNANFSFASTGKIFAQIRQGAPFDVFLAADQKTPASCVKQGDCVAASAFTYATGKLVLVSHDPAALRPSVDALSRDFKHLAIANPETAPYGTAARQILTNLRLDDKLGDRIIQGDSVTQTYLFVSSGAAELGFVAQSQVRSEPETSYWILPQELYAPLPQSAVLTQRGDNNPTARKFLEFLRSEKALAIIRTFGYNTDAPD